MNRNTQTGYDGIVYITRNTNIFSQNEIYEKNLVGENYAI